MNNLKKKKVASIAVFNADGLLLFGRRADNGKWTLPGGNFEEGEHPVEAAERELAEETGLECEGLQFLGAGLAGREGEIEVYCYRCVTDGSPTNADDPDEEIDQWQWVEPHDIPEEIASNLHSKKNITLRLLNLQPGEVEAPLQKAAEPHFIERNVYRGFPIRIPKMGTKARKQYDKDFHSQLVETFAGGDAGRLRKIRVPVDAVSNTNMAVNKSRLDLYKRMAKAKDKLPPVVVQRSGEGYTLLDGNHRQEAAKAARLTHLDAYELLPEMKKSAAGLLAGLALMASPAQQLKTAMDATQKAPESQVVPRPSFQQAAQEVGVPVSKWTNDSLHQDLWPIAHLESSWGKNINHATNKKGEFHTAFGAVGFKPVTAHEEYMKSKALQKLYPNLNAPEDFLKTFKADPKFYNMLASTHFARLKARHGSAPKAAYAWRWGTGAAAKATDDQIDNDLYVQRYKGMKLDANGKQLPPEKLDPLAKSEDPIDSMMHHDDPRERIMALRSRFVTPYHLLQALHDEDPDVRAFAAHHPQLTPQLIETALKHPDHFTRSQILDRPDLLPHHLEMAIFDPELQVKAARHPSLSEEQRQRLIGASIPDGLRNELSKTQSDGSLWHRGTKTAEGLPKFASWFTNDRESASGFGPHVASFSFVRKPHLLAVFDYGEACKKLGVPNPKNASRDLLLAAHKAGYDGYHYKNPLFSDEELALVQPHLFLEQKLEKKTPPKFPGFGVTDDRRPIQIVDTPRQYKLQEAKTNNHVKMMGFSPRKPGLPSAGEHYPAIPDSGNALGNSMRHRLELLAKVPVLGSGKSQDDQKAVMATVLHEGLHSALSRAAYKVYDSNRKMFGRDRPKNVTPQVWRDHLAANLLKPTLSTNLVNAIHHMISDHDAKNWDSFHLNRYGIRSGYAADRKMDEERLTTLFNYLNSPLERNSFYDKVNQANAWGKGLPAANAQEHDASMKRVYKAFTHAANLANHNWVLPEHVPETTLVGNFRRMGHDLTPEAFARLHEDGNLGSIRKAEDDFGFEPLEKGRKDAQQMYKPEHPGAASAKEHINWAYSKMPNENWSMWTVRHHREHPEDFTPEVKNKLERYSRMSQEVPELGNLRFEKGHSLEQGMGLLDTAEKQYIKRKKESLSLASRPKTAKKLLDFGDGTAWWSLGRGSCSSEGKAMGHCGNVPSERGGDEVYSLRTSHRLGGTIYYEPHLTFIAKPARGIIGEMKGRSNQKPAPEYHDKIVALLNHTKLAPVGGGYAPERNFHLDDLTDAQRRQVLGPNKGWSVLSRKESLDPEELIAAMAHPHLAAMAATKLADSKMGPTRSDLDNRLINAAMYSPSQDAIDWGVSNATDPQRREFVDRIKNDPSISEVEKRFRINRFGHTLLNSPHTSADTIREFAKDYPALASHLNTPRDVVRDMLNRHFANNDHGSVRHTVSHPALTADDLLHNVHTIASKSNSWDPLWVHVPLEDMIVHPNANQAVFDEAVKVPGFLEEREAPAESLFIENRPDLQKRIMDGQRFQPKMALLRNPAANKETLLSAINLEGGNTTMANVAARHTSFTPVEIEELASKDYNSDEPFYGLYHNPNATPELRSLILHRALADSTRRAGGDPELATLRPYDFLASSKLPVKDVAALAPHISWNDGYSFMRALEHLNSHELQQVLDTLKPTKIAYPYVAGELTRRKKDEADEEERRKGDAELEAAYGQQ